MAYQVKVGSTWKDAIPHVKVGNAWKEVQEAYVKVGSTWKKVWENWTHKFAVSSTNYYGELIFGFADGSKAYQKMGSMTPATFEGATIHEIVGPERAGADRIILSKTISSQYIVLEAKTGQKFKFSKSTNPTTHFNFIESSGFGTRQQWRDFLYDNIRNTIDIRLSTQ